MFSAKIPNLERKFGKDHVREGSTGSSDKLVIPFRKQLCYTGIGALCYIALRWWHENANALHRRCAPQGQEREGPGLKCDSPSLREGSLFEKRRMNACQSGVVARATWVLLNG